MSNRAETTIDLNVKLIKDIYAAFGRGDVAAIAAKVAPRARWDFNVGNSDVPWHRPVTGPAEVPKFLAAFIENVQVETFEPRRFIASGEDVIVHLRLAYVVRKSGKRVEEEQLQWWTVRDGKVAGLRHFEDTAQVIGAWRD
jgi:ketosteroid isomerase-like protein